MTNRQREIEAILQNIDTTLYSDRWIALVRGRVIGVGLTARQAYRAAMQTRSKDKPQLIFIDGEGKASAQTDLE